MKSPMLLIAGFFALGILLEHPQRWGIMPLFGVTVVCLLAAVASLLKRRNRAAAASLLMGFAGAGAATQALFQCRFPADHIRYLAAWGFDPAMPLDLEGTVGTGLVHTPSGLEFDLSAARASQNGRAHPATGKVRVRARSAEQFEITQGGWKLRFGDPVRASVRLWRPRTHRNPGGFDYGAWMESIQDIYWQASLRRIAILRSSKILRPPAYKLIFHAARRRLIQAIDRMFPPWSARGRDGAVLKAILLGDRASLDSSTVENFRVSGLYHLLVVAGLHVGLLAALFAGLLRLLKVRETARFILMITFLAFYAGLVEQRAPTLRATLMIASYLTASFLYREHSALNAVGLAGFLLLLARPAWLFETGFQLSFSAALLIVGLAVPILERTTEPYRKALWRLDDRDYESSLESHQAQFRDQVRETIALLKENSSLLARYPTSTERLVVYAVRGAIWAVDLFVFSTVLQFGLLLPMAQIFHRVTLAGIGLNALAVPLMAVLLAVAAPTVLLYAAFAGTPIVFSWPLALLIRGLLGLTELSHLPAWLSFRVPNPPFGLAWGFAISIVAAALALGRSRRFFGISSAAALLCGALIALHPFPPKLPSGSLQVTALDCDACETFFLVLPDRTTILVGAGGSTQGRGPRGGAFRPSRWDPGEDLVSPYLWSRGLDHLDVLFIPDASGNRLDGVPAILRNFKVQEFWYGSLSPGQTATALMALLGDRGVHSRLLRAGERIEEPAAGFEVLWPPAASLGSSPESKPDAVALKISTLAGSALLLGNISRAAQRQIASNTPDLRSDVLVIPNRGDAGCCAPKLMERVSPQIALLSGAGEKANTVEEGEIAQRLPGMPLVLSTASLGAVTVQVWLSHATYHGYQQSAKTITFGVGR
jgi:competence protein ComEC